MKLIKALPENYTTLVMIKKYLERATKLYHAVKNFFSSDAMLYVQESNNWVISEEAKKACSILSHHGVSCRATSTPYGARNKILHFGSINSILKKNNGVKNVHPTNRLVLSWYHTEPGDPRLDSIPELKEKLTSLHTSCTQTENLLVQHGMPVEKIRKIPIPLDQQFLNNCRYHKQSFRDQFEIPKDHFVIGSFQKDGNGWGEGKEPKLIKGPDIFCEVIRKLAQKHKIFVLLSGPSRGFVKDQLSKDKIQFKHFYFNNYYEVINLYKCLDAYLISSRVEGGPKSMLESFAMKVPLVATKVGMVQDYAIHRKNALLSEIEDVAGLVQNLEELISNPTLAKQLVDEAFRAARELTHEILIPTYKEKLYKL